LHYPAIARSVALPPALEATGQKGMDLLRELHTLAASRPDVTPPVLLERFRERPELPHLAQLLAEEPLVGEDGAAAEFAGCLERILAAAVQQELSSLLQKAGDGALSPAERERLAALQRTVVAGSVAQPRNP
ncbi:MAG: hypothetical protein J0M16_08845, partial [Gammaproteobacteria bacterium]|nr:hypothetical protein [Gammaproteobacteria bacterium]